MKKILAFLILASSAFAQLVPENTLPVTSTLSDTDKVRVVKGGVSMSAAAEVVRQITASKITDASILGRNWITTASPSALTFPRINADNTITYLNAEQFLAAIGGGAASVTIQEIDGDPVLPFNVLEVTDGTLTDLGGGIVRLTIGGGTGGGSWGTITGTLSSQTDLQAALDAKQPLDADLTAIAALSTQAYGLSLLTLSSSSGLLASLGAQAADADLDDLADGSLSGSKVGTGINAANITTGTLALARGGLARDASGDTSGLFGILAGTSTDIDTIAEFSTALGITGTQSSSTVLRGDGTWGASAGAITVTEEDSSPAVSSVSEIRVTNGSLIDNGSGSISLDLSGGVGGGDVISDVGVSVGNEIVLFAGVTGKHVAPYTGTGIITATSGVIGTVTNSAGLAAGLSDESGTGSVAFTNAPTFTTPQLGAASASSVTSPFFQSNAADTADTGVLRLANAEVIAWENNPASTDNTLTVNSSNVMTTNVTFSAVTLQEGGVAVPNANDSLSFFGTGSTSSAQLAGVLSDEVGTGRFILETNATLITPTISGNLTYLNGYQYADAAMAALVIDTSELNNTKSVAADSTFTFSGAPATGAVFGLQVTNTDVAVHTITIPSSKSDALGGAARTTFQLAAGSTSSLKWRYEGGANYTVWGDPFSINELTADATPDVAADYVMTYDNSAGTHKKVLLNALPTGSGDNVSIDGVAVVDPDFTSAGDIDFVSAGSPATVTAVVQPDSVALAIDTTGDYVSSLTAGLGLTGTVTGESSTPTIALDESAALTGNHTLGANEEIFGQSGIIFEGGTADNIETYISVADPTSSDKSIQVPDASGTVILSGHTFTGNVTATLGSGGTTALTITGNAVNGADIALGGDAIGDMIYYDGTDYALLAAGTANYVLQANGAAAPTWVDSAASTQTLTNKTITAASNVLPAELILAASDETTPITSGTGKVTFRMPYAMTVTSVRASLTTAQASGSVLTMDINDSGTSILSTKLTIDNGAKTSVGAAAPAVISDSALADDAEISVDVDTIGASGAAGLKITLIGTR